ncbi:four-carbon acid sugar kinase family protein [Flavobacterium flavipallidum]|uniref:Four-carbon acid sugar kinase family protein n=1 Tax=Flavobacterium flavipallidum TaxID=3139140 RepID=A0ABU9HNR1_9FLAO
MKKEHEILLAYYGDDFTGSTDALEFLTLAGVKTVLFLRPPLHKDLALFPGVQAIGLAGKSRSMSPTEMEEELYPAFETLRDFNAEQVHYKVCSTFDSAPHVGNIGKAIEIGSEVFNQKSTYISPAAPHLGRFCAFGNLFAKMGTVGTGDIFRIDRHPSMSTHPVTPAHEADLRLHLAQQTQKSIDLVNITTIEKGAEAVLEELQNKKDAEIVFFDGLNTGHLKTIGTVFQQKGKEKTLFTVGSSGIEMALGLAWKEDQLIQKEFQFEHPGEASPLLVISGSCSPVTAGQIEYTLKNGYEGIALESKVMHHDHQEQSITEVAQQIITHLENGNNTILHTSIGTNDKRIAATEAYLKQSGLTPKEIQKQSSKIYGRVLGQIIKTVLKSAKIKRILFAGGDTSSYAASELGIFALEMIAPLAPGAPLCKAISEDNTVNGIELNFKGGQVGTPDYFIKVQKGEKLT